MNVGEVACSFVILVSDCIFVAFPRCLVLVFKNKYVKPIILVVARLKR